MRVMRHFAAVLMLSAQLVITSPLVERSQYYTMGGSTCTMCPAGQYQKSCTECEPCPAGSYTSEFNREDSCHSCFSDCRPDFHLKVIQSCTRTSNLKCSCEAGYICTDYVPYSENCRYCEKIQRMTTAAPDKDKQTRVSSGHSTAFTPPCQFPNCPRRNDTDLTTTDKTSHLVAILCSVVAMAFIALIILFCVRCSGDETCFKLAIMKLHNKGGRDASSHKMNVSTRQSSRDSASAKHQPACLSATNLGSVHVHNPGTVIFSLLSQFTGQIGLTKEEGTSERVNNEEEEGRDCSVFHPTSSPCTHLSEEERSADTDRVFFPSQEQGKDCHISKEEVL
ncbi:hypothetical protein LDENG_00050190 [Lucifuga dentata]|nr:hypothetical protein LDENG_00050190 [Lucifuga dentata]